MIINAQQQNNYTKQQRPLLKIHTRSPSLVLTSAETFASIQHSTNYLSFKLNGNSTHTTN